MAFSNLVVSFTFETQTLTLRSHSNASLPCRDDVVAAVFRISNIHQLLDYCYTYSCLEYALWCFAVCLKAFNVLKYRNTTRFSPPCVNKRRGHLHFYSSISDLFEVNIRRSFLTSVPKFSRYKAECKLEAVWKIKMKTFKTIDLTSKWKPTSLLKWILLKSRETDWNVIVFWWKMLFNVNGAYYFSDSLIKIKQK